MILALLSVVKGLEMVQERGAHTSKGFVILLPSPAGELALLKAGWHLVQEGLPDLPLKPPSAVTRAENIRPCSEGL